MNNIIFADLSTYTPGETIAFYEKVFGWKYYHQDGYYTAFLNTREVVGLYETPDKFKQMRMPHFWMTYIQVADVHKAADKARELGGIIELVDESNPIGAVALIRDPQGAGFTIYGGNAINTRTSGQRNTLIWNEIHVSDIEKIIPFYEGIFDWRFEEKDDGLYEIRTMDRKHIADASEIPNLVKGRYEYWVCTFGVESLARTKDLILDNGGSLLNDEGRRILFSDNSGQAFFYVQEV